MVRLPDGRGLVQTVDFFTPVVNDPFRFGRIAAANALSDVYAMGGEPLACMNIVCFPIKTMDQEILRLILQGGLDAVREAGAVPAGGHSVEDDEIKYGLAVSGLVDPDRIAANAGFRPGDLLVLTKPLGTGILATAIKAKWEGYAALEETIFQWAGKLSRAGARAVQEVGIRGATDVTGFGLGGHLLEALRASGVSAEVELSSLPIMEPALELASMGLVPAGSHANRDNYAALTEIAPGAEPLRVDLAFDAQTSGGLLLAVPRDRLERVREMLEGAGDLARVVGRVVDADDEGPRLFLK